MVEGSTLGVCVEVEPEHYTEISIQRLNDEHERIEDEYDRAPLPRLLLIRSNNSHGKDTIVEAAFNL